MQTVIVLDGLLWAVDLGRPLDISIESILHSDRQPQAFFLPKARAAAVEIGAFVGDTRRGGSCNCDSVTLVPHGNGTHTECVGHITADRVGIHDTLKDAFIPATVLTVEPEPFAASGETYPWPHDGAELAVTRAGLERALAASGCGSPAFTRALVIRTLPNPDAKRGASYSGTCPAYLTAEAARWIAEEREVEHLLVDLPSVDREEDGGGLHVHRVFWGAGPRRSITEMVFVSAAIADGPYLLNLQIPPLALDAAPSRPLLFAARRAAS